MRPAVLASGHPDWTAGHQSPAPEVRKSPMLSRRSTRASCSSFRSRRQRPSPVGGGPHLKTSLATKRVRNGALLFAKPKGVPAEKPISARSRVSVPGLLFARYVLPLHGHLRPLPPAWPRNREVAPGSVAHRGGEKLNRSPWRNSPNTGSVGAPAPSLSIQQQFDWSPNTL